MNYQGDSWQKNYENSFKFGIVKRRPVMLVLGLGLGLKESLRTISWSLTLALALRTKSLALALALKQSPWIGLVECGYSIAY